MHRMTRCRYMAIRNFSRLWPAAILYLAQPEVAPFRYADPERKPYHRTKYEMDRIIRCTDNGHSIRPYTSRYHRKTPKIHFQFFSYIIFT